MFSQSITNFLTFEETRGKSIDLLPEFLAHAFPKVCHLLRSILFRKSLSSGWSIQVRADTAEYIYVLLQSADLGFEAEEVEDLLLETEWYVNGL